MSTIRSEMVIKAKSMGICTQCLRLKSLKNGNQCQRCLDTGRRKYKMRCARANPLRRKIMNYASKHDICTKCFGRSTKDTDCAQCEVCREVKRMWKERYNAKKQRKIPSITKQREYTKRYKKKSLLKKVIKLDRIRYAVEQDKILPVSTTFKTIK